MTGMYIRVERDGRWQNIEVDQMTDTELEDFAASQAVEKGWVWALGLARWIRDHVQGDGPAHEGEEDRSCR